jgi:hypothetical protein
LIAQEADVEQAKAQEVTVKKAIEAASVGDEPKEKDELRKALVKVGKNPLPVSSPSTAEVQGSRKAAKSIKAPILLCVSRTALVA